MRRSPIGIAAVLVLCLAGLAPAARAQGTGRRERVADPQERNRELVSEARQRHGSARLKTAYHLPNATLHVDGAEQLAAVPGSTVRLEVHLDRPAPGAQLLVTVPEDFVHRAPSGIRGADPAALAPGAPAGADVGQAGRAVVLDVGRGHQGDDPAIEIGVGSLDAGTYELPLRWRTPVDGTVDAGTARLRLYARSREEGEVLRERQAKAEGDNPWSDMRTPFPAGPIDSSGDSGEESESFIAVSPLDRQRLLAAGNKIEATSHDASISDDGGQTWSPLDFPNADAQGRQAIIGPNGTEFSYASGDPIQVGDDLGNLWMGGLTTCQNPGDGPSRIFLFRIPAGSDTFTPTAAGLPNASAGSCSVVQDKPMLSIDNAPHSPTYGRLYATWDAPASGGAVNVVISGCDTRVAGVAQAARCDSGANWSNPVPVSGPAGSYITSHSAVGPDGKVYVVWWNYGTANAVQMAECDTSCTSGAGWTQRGTIAVLDSTDGPDGGNKPDPVPFACPIVAQPGGRAAPVPSVAVDHSGGPDNGRIYVGWADLRPGSGTTRCSDNTQPLVTHLTWDAYVASGTSFAALTASPTAVSSARGTRLITDTGNNASGTNSDDWFSWVAVDQTNGKVWTDAYSTRSANASEAAARQSTEFVLGSVGAPFTGTKPTVGSATTVSSARSNYSDTTPCCQFDNDYGDYTGLVATEDQVYPVWTDRQLGSDGDVFVLGLTPGAIPHIVHDQATLAEGAGGDGDGLLEPGEPLRLTERLRNTGNAATNVDITSVTSFVPGVSVSGAEDLGSVAAGATAENATPFSGTLPAGLPCGAPVDFRITYTDGTDTHRVQFIATTACSDAVSVADATVSEGAGTALVTVTRAAPTAGTVTVRLDTADDSATAPGDYTAQADHTVTFTGSQTTQTVAIPITDDAVSEPSERFAVILSAPTGGAHLGRSVGYVTITDDDPPPPPPPTTGTTTQPTTGTTTPAGTGTQTTPAGTGTTPVPGSGIRDTLAPLIRLGALPRRVDSLRRASFRLGPMSEAVAGTLTLRTATAIRVGTRTRVLTLGRATFTAATGKVLRLRLRLSAADLRVLRSRGRLRVRLTVVMTDAAGNRATRRAPFTLRPPRTG